MCVERDAYQDHTPSQGVPSSWDCPVELKYMDDREARGAIGTDSEFKRM